MITQSENNNSNQSDPKRTFIERARRAQIVEATVNVLAEDGYLNVSFARIATRAGISTSLIPYHFKNKEELMNEVFQSVMQDRVRYVEEKVAQATRAVDKLRIALESDLAHMGTRPKYFHAVNEILFSRRGSKGALVFLGDLDDPMLVLIQTILEFGQENGEFGSFDAYHLAISIDGAKDTFLAQLLMRPRFNLEVFTQTLVDFALKGVAKRTEYISNRF